MTVMGIDPGLKGGIAILSPCGARTLYPMPLKNGAVCARGVYDILLRHKPALVVMESLLVLPHNSRVSISVMGFNWGRVAGVVEAMGVPFRTVAPTEWQRGLLVPKGPSGTAKLRILARAQILFPGETFVPPGKKVFQDGLMDALMIAKWGEMRR